MKIKSLFILSALCFFALTASVIGSETQSDIDIYEAVKIAEELLLSDELYEYYAQDYKNRKLAISVIEKHYTQCNFLLFDSPCVCEDMQADKFVQLHPMNTYSERVFEVLESRTYWLVYFSNNTSKIVLGGDIAFFIDAKTSELLYVYRGA